MQRDHPLSQRNMTTEKTMGTGAGGGREVGGVGGGVEGGVWTKLKKEWGGGLHKITGLAPSAYYVKRL